MVLGKGIVTEVLADLAEVTEVEGEQVLLLWILVVVEQYLHFVLDDIDESGA